MWELGALCTSEEYYRLVLLALRPIVPVADSDVRQALANLLARTRQQHPDDVDDFIYDAFSETEAMEVHRRITTMEVEETIGGDLLALRALFFLVDAAHSPSLRPTLVWVWRSAVACRDISQWFTLIAKRIVNLVHGSDVFSLSAP
jgi:hypothetical protein